jgi:hypothetical protein
MNREIAAQIFRSVIRHAITLYGGPKLLSGELSGAIEGVIAITIALIWSYLEKKSPKVDARGNDKEP